MYTNTFIVMCLLFLSCVVNPLFAQEIEEVATETDNKAYQITSDSIFLTSDKQKSESYAVILATPCVSTFSNQTVNSFISVLGCSTLAVQYVTVTNTGNLSLSAPEAITINGNFEVKSGGVLNVFKSTPQQKLFKYYYDASGNRISRQVSLTN